MLMLAFTIYIYIPDLEILRTQCTPSASQLTAQNAFWHLLNLLDFEHHIERHCGLSLDSVSVSDTFETLNSRAITGHFNTFKYKCQFGYCPSGKPESGPIYRRTKEGFERGRTWQSSNSKASLLSFINNLPLSAKLTTVVVTEQSQVVVMNRLFREMRDLIPSDHILVHKQKWKLDFAIEGLNTSRVPSPKEMNVLRSIPVRDLCAEKNVDMFFLEELTVHKNELYKLTVMDPTNHFIATNSVLLAQSLAADGSLVLEPCSSDPSATYHAHITVGMRTQKILCRSVSGVQVGRDESLYISITQYPLHYPAATTVSALAGMTIPGGIAFANSASIPKGGGYVALTRAPSEEKLIMNHVPINAMEANSHDFSTTLASATLDKFHKICLGNKDDGVIDGNFHLKCVRRDYKHYPLDYSIVQPDEADSILHSECEKTFYPSEDPSKKRRIQ
jgi:hypothetical protein